MSAAARIHTYDLYGRPEGWQESETQFCGSLKDSRSVYTPRNRVTSNRQLDPIQFPSFLGRWIRMRRSPLRTSVFSTTIALVRMFRVPARTGMNCRDVRGG